MALLTLTERQKTAERLVRELQALGATVTNVLPLAEVSNLRFWVSDYKKNEILQQLTDAGYQPVFLGVGFQFCINSYSLGAVNNFELPLPAERQPVADDRTIRGELTSSASKSDFERQHEEQQMRRYLGLDIK